LTDVYSLGAILYELLTGKIPFAAATPLETFRQIEQREPIRPESVNSNVARDLSVICLKCMEKEPGRRYGSALALAEDLERWLRNEPIQARTAGPVLRLRRWVRRNRIGTALILALVLLLGVTTTLLIVVNEAKHTADETGKELRSLISEQDKVRYRLAMDTRVRLEELWVRPDKESLAIGWDDLAAVSGNAFNKVTNETKLLKLKVGLSANANPVDEARLHAPLLARLEQLMSERLEREVRLDLWMYKISGDRIPALVNGKLDFARMGALPAMKAVREGLPVRMLVEQINPGRRATFFTRSDTGIKSFADLKGKAMAFGETNSTINYVAQMKLLKAGISAADFSKYDFLDSLSAFMKGVEEDGIDEVTESVGGVLSSHTEVVRAVRNGEYDAGICSLKVFEKNARYGLIRIPNGEFDNVRNPWIGRSDLPPEVINSFLESMKALDEQKDGFLRTLPDHPTGFRPITEGTHESEREVMRKIQDLFPIKAPITVGAPEKTLRRKK
jgi:ABC-type phosphate/phosphonate transport system substrate-binding protein